MIGTRSQFDWYAATIRDYPEVIARALCESLGADQEEAPGLHGYESGMNFRGPSGIVARMIFGGPNGLPHAWASGESAPAFVRSVRSFWGQTHYVTRVDVFEDFDAPGAWDKLSRLAVSFAKSRELKIRCVGDFKTKGGPDGRTIYIGSRQSAGCVRVYEKGKELRAKGLAENPSLNHVRVEAEIKPDGDARYAAAGLSAEDMWGLTSTTAGLISVLTPRAPERLYMQPRKRTSDEVSMNHVCKQYAAIFLREARTHGGFESFGREVGFALERGFYRSGRSVAGLENGETVDRTTGEIRKKIFGFTPQPGLFPKDGEYES